MILRERIKEPVPAPGDDELSPEDVEKAKESKY